MPDAAPAPPLFVRWTVPLVRRLPAGRYRVMDWLCRRRPPAAAFWARAGRQQGGYRFRCDLRDGIAREVCFTGRYEPQETAVVKAILRPGDVFLDVGANWGYFTLLAAHLVGTAGRVVGLEPDPRLFSLLRENVAENGLGQVQALPVAAAHETGTMSLAGFDETGGNFGLSQLSPAAAGGGRTFTVPTRTLDDVVDELGARPVDLLKMDVEGAEGMALAGLLRSLAAHRVRRLLLELHPAQLAQHGESVATVVSRLSAAGYRPWRVDHSPAATRRTAYATNPCPRSLLRPLDRNAPADGLDEWPHLLWIAPGVELFP